MGQNFDPMTLRLENGTTVLEASAGTGKTFTIVQLAVRILMGDTSVATRGPRHLLLVTFTRAATAELLERLRAAIRTVEAIHNGKRSPTPATAWITSMLERQGQDAGPRIEMLIGRLDELTVTTIHGFCVGVLEEFPEQCGVSGELVFRDDDTDLMSEELDNVIRSLCWTDPLTAAGVIAGNCDRRTVLQTINALRRHGDTEFDPPLDATLSSGVHVAMDSVRTRWNRDEMVEAFARDVWLEKHEMYSPEFRDALLADLEAFIAGDLTRLASVLHFVPATFDKWIMKRSSEQKLARQELLDIESIRALMQLAGIVRKWLDHLRVDIAHRVLQRLPIRKQRDQVATFDDQIRLVRQGLSHPESGDRLAESLHDRYDALLVDEAQDTDPAQWEIFTRGFAHRPLIIVGDPKQAIYSWRGADLRSYIEARDRAGAGRLVRLDQNWRSTPALLSAIEQLFRYRPDPFGVSAAEMDFVPVQAGRPRPSLADPRSRASFRWIMPAEPDATASLQRRIREAIVAEVRRLLDEVKLEDRSVRPGDIAILVGTHARAAEYRQSLAALGINAVVAGSGDVTDSIVWRELRLLLAAIGTPDSNDATKRAASTRLAGFTATELGEWGSNPLAESLLVWQEQLHTIAEHAETFGVLAALSQLFGARGTVVRLTGYPDGERWLTDLRHVMELVQEAEVSQQLNAVTLAHWMERWADSKGEERERRQLRLESDADAVQIRTMYAAKGLEYPIVFVPDCWGKSGKDPDEPVVVWRQGEWQAVFKHSDNWDVARQEAIDMRFTESLRLAYVALTRAAARCYVALGCSDKNGAFGALSWLLRPAGAGDCRQQKDNWPDTVLAVNGLIETSDGAMDKLPEMGTVSISPVAPRTEPLVATARVDRQRSMASWRLISYTWLVSKGKHNARHDLADPSGPIDRSRRTDLDLLTPGATSGVAVHRIFEQLAFDALPTAIAQVVTGVLRDLALTDGMSSTDQPALVGALTDAIVSTLATPIPGFGFAMRDVKRDRCLTEWQFHLSLEQADLDALITRLRIRGGWQADYATSLARLDVGTVSGFLTGVIDLAFEHEGRWYLVDWKSNHLGHDPAAYSPESLQLAMMQHHYVLQYHLYLMALERFLATRIPDWDAATMMGGVAYAFVRGPGWFTEM